MKCHRANDHQQITTSMSDKQVNDELRESLLGQTVAPEIRRIPGTALCDEVEAQYSTAP